MCRSSAQYLALTKVVAEASARLWGDDTPPDGPKRKDRTKVGLNEAQVAARSPIEHGDMRGVVGDFVFGKAHDQLDPDQQFFVYALTESMRKARQPGYSSMFHRAVAGYLKDDNCQTKTFALISRHFKMAMSRAHYNKIRSKEFKSADSDGGDGDGDGEFGSVYAQLGLNLTQVYNRPADNLDVTCAVVYKCWETVVDKMLHLVTGREDVVTFEQLEAEAPEILAMMHDESKLTRTELEALLPDTQDKDEMLAAIKALLAPDKDDYAQLGAAIARRWKFNSISRVEAALHTPTPNARIPLYCPATQSKYDNVSVGDFNSQAVVYGTFNISVDRGIDLCKRFGGMVEEQDEHGAFKRHVMTISNPKLIGAMMPASAEFDGKPCGYVADQLEELGERNFVHATLTWLPGQPTVKVQIARMNLGIWHADKATANQLGRAYGPVHLSFVHSLMRSSIKSVNRVLFPKNPDESDGENAILLSATMAVMEDEYVEAGATAGPPTVENVLAFQEPRLKICPLARQIWTHACTLMARLELRAAATGSDGKAMLSNFKILGFLPCIANSRSYAEHTIREILKRRCESEIYMAVFDKFMLATEGSEGSERGLINDQSVEFGQGGFRVAMRNGANSSRLANGDTFKAANLAAREGANNTALPTDGVPRWGKDKNKKKKKKKSSTATHEDSVLFNAIYDELKAAKIFCPGCDLQLGLAKSVAEDRTAYPPESLVSMTETELSLSSSTGAEAIGFQRQAELAATVVFKLKLKAFKKAPTINLIDASTGKSRGLGRMQHDAAWSTDPNVLTYGHWDRKRKKYELGTRTAPPTGAKQTYTKGDQTDELKQRRERALTPQSRALPLPDDQVWLDADDYKKNSLICEARKADFRRMKLEDPTFSIPDAPAAYGESEDTPTAPAVPVLSPLIACAMPSWRAQELLPSTEHLLVEAPAVPPTGPVDPMLGSTHWATIATATALADDFF